MKSDRSDHLALSDEIHTLLPAGVAAPPDWVRAALSGTLCSRDWSVVEPPESQPSS